MIQMNFSPLVVHTNFLWEKKNIQVKNALKSFKELKLFEGKEVTFFNSNFFSALSVGNSLAHQWNEVKFE